MESFREQESGVLLQDPPIEKLADSSFFEEADSLPFEEFLDALENELASAEKEDGETNEYYLNKIKETKKFFIERLKNEKNKNAARVMFDIQEYVNQFNFGLEKEELPIKLKGSELQRDSADFVFKNENKEELAEFWRIYDKFFKLGGKKVAENGEGMKNAILSMVGLKKILTKNYIAEVFFTEPDVDVFNSIDMVARMDVKNDEERKVLFFQVKSLSGEKISNVKWKKFDSDDLGWNTKFEEKENNFKKGCAKYLNDKASIFNKIGKENISAVFVRLPIRDNGKVSVDIDGEPHQALEKFIVEKIDGDNPNLAKINKYDIMKNSK